MCGILGSVNLTFDHTILDLISHRGPDFAHIEQYDVADNTIHFGHRRLAILDLTEAGNQPMSTEDNRFSIIFNGEIFNHQELRTNLTDIEFRGHSDTETILYYLAKNGIEGVRDFNGQFAFAFLDKEAKKLFLARDPFGVKPLYFYQEDREMVFSSEIRPINALIRATLNKAALAQSLKLRYNPAENTLYNEIKKLMPGHYIECNLSDFKIILKPFIKPRLIKKELSLQQAVNQYGDLFEKAVKRQLMADVGIGVLLSGGIDSALVTYFAVKNSKDKIKSFTIGFEDDDDANELEEARISSNILGTHHYEVVIGQKDFGAMLEEVVRTVEEPLGTTSSIPMYFLNKEVAKHVKVVLTGQGADEPLGGYARYKGELYRKIFPPFLSRLLKPVAPLIKNEKIRRFLMASGERDIVRRFEKTYMLFDDDSIQRLTGLVDRDSYTSIDYFYRLVNGDSITPLEAMMSIDKHMNLADDLLLYTDKVSMHFGVETRVPVLDFELIEYIESLPMKFRIHQGEGKYIHKEFAKLVLPEKIVNRKKKGFKSPTGKWFEQDLGEMIQKVLKDNSNIFNQLFDSNEVNEILYLHKRGYNQEKQLFLILSLYFWFKNATL